MQSSPCCRNFIQFLLLRKERKLWELSKFPRGRWAPLGWQAQQKQAGGGES